MSGEHGIGVEKLEALPLVFTADDLLAQSFVKGAFDPRGLANPGKALIPAGGGQSPAGAAPEGARAHAGV